MDNAVHKLQEDLEHAHALLALMSPDELLKATHALEEIVEDSPRFRSKLDAAANGPMVPMEEVLAEYGLSMADFEQRSGEIARSAAVDPNHGEAA
jgi:hypothetical protein